MKHFKAIAAMSVLGIVGCDNSDEIGNGQQSGVSAQANVSVQGTPAATASTTLDVEAAEQDGGVRIAVAAAGLPPGEHGLHVHEIGRCEEPGFTSAGAHWNPTGREHGRDNPAGAHAGDLPNLVIDSAGRGRTEFVISGATLVGGARPMYDNDGAALLVHAKADDYRTDPTGDSGDRIACSVLAAAK